MDGVPVTKQDHSQDKDLDAGRISREADEFLNRLGTGVVHLDGSQRIVGLSDASRRILRLPEGDLHGRALREVLSEPLAGRISSAVDRALRRNALVGFPVSARFPGDIQVFVRCLPTPGGAVVAVEDTGELEPPAPRHMERERQDLEKLYEQMESELIKLEAVLEQLPSGVIIEEAPGGRLLYHNAQVDRLLGHPVIAARDYEGRGRYGALHEDGGIYLPEEYPIARALKGESISTEDVSYRRGDGTFIHLSVSAAPIRDLEGGIVAAVSIFNDITDRKRAQDALRESEEKLRNIVENSTNVFYSHTPDGRLIYLSPQFEKIFDYDPKDRVLFWTDTLTDNPVNRKAVESTREAIRTGRPQPSYEMELKVGGGRTIWVEVNESPVVRDGKTVMIVGALQDITERKKAEEERREMERRIQQSQKLESLGVMAGGIAHDFNNLLTAILGNIDLALMGGPENPRARSFIEQARTATLRASDLTGQMLAYSGKGRFHVKPFNLNRLVEEMTGLLKASISKSVILRLDADRSIPDIKADPTQIRQIVMNLIVNASEAIGEKPGVISIGTGVRECDDSCFERSRIRQKPRPGTYVFLEVKDTGCGMDEQTRERLFDPFFTTKFTGRGLGMAAVLGIVEGHGGAIMIQSEPGKGTTATVMFPVHVETGKDLAPAGSGPAGEPMKARPESSARTVLVVDDEEAVLNLCRAMVEQMGFTVLTASNGHEALEVFRGHAGEVSLVILDLTMPEMDGVTALHELRRIREDVRIIVSSGYNEQEVCRRFEGQEPDGFITKPFAFDRLRDKIGRVLERG